MKIEEIRPSFTVYTIASQGEKLAGLAEALGLAGYLVANFTEVTAAFSEFYSNPPHFVILDFEESKFNVRKAIKQISAQLPETHVLLVTPIEARETAAALLEEDVYDLILTPLGSPIELVRALDRAAERDYFMYLNERLTQQINAGPPPAPAELSPDAITRATMLAESSAIYPVHGDATLNAANQMLSSSTPDQAVEHFLRWTAGGLASCPAFFMKYVPNRRVLLATQAHGIDGFEGGGLGLNFNEHGEGFRTAQLRQPKELAPLRTFVREVFHHDEFWAFPVEAMGEIQGLAIFLRPPPGEREDGMLNDAVRVFSRSLALLEAEKRLHSLNVKDAGTGLLNRQNFLAKVRDEISRARRTSLPVSLALLTLDQYGQIVSQVGQEEAETLLKMAARIFEKHSRVNDLIGRTGADEFGIVLPHTGKQGALIKAERLRRIIESADFSRVVSGFPNVTISLGVSEYPSMSRDAEELMQTADEALFQVRASGNKTCVAKPPEGFVADFEVHEKGL